LLFAVDEPDWLKEAISDNVAINYANEVIPRWRRAIPVVNTTFNPGWVDVPILVPTGGKSRKKIPKPWQKDVDMIDHN